MIMPGRTYSSGSNYRYGFNGKEQDSAVNGTGIDYDYGFRIYDARAGRFLSVDPLTGKFAMLTPYQFANNNPIGGIDLAGLEFLSVNSSIYQQEYLGKTTSLIGVSSNNYVVKTVYENIPNTLKNPQTHDLKFTYGGVVGAFGKDLDISIIQSSNPESRRYYHPISEFWGSDLDAQPVSSKSTEGLYNFNTKSDASERNTANSEQLASSAEVSEHAAGIINNQLNIKTWNAMGLEDKNRYYFYQATNIVDNYLQNNRIGDKSLTTGAGRADLINFLTDGTLPTGNTSVSNLSQNGIEKDLRTFYTGYQILLKENIPYQSDLTSKFLKLNNAYKKNGGTLNFDSITQFKYTKKNN